MNIPREAIICSGRHLAAANEITLGKKPVGFGGVCQGCEFEGRCRMVQTAPAKDVSNLDTAGAQVQPQAEPGGPPLSFDDIPLVMRVEALVPILRVKKHTIYELIRSGQLRGVLVGHQLRVFKQDLVAFLKQEPAQEPETESQAVSK